MNSKYKFVFVILHYITIDDTKKCVESIHKYCDGYDYNIVIVENGSPNNSYKELQGLYKNNNSIKLIINKQNLGFARGNNLGFEYSKEKLNADFIILCNNDTMLINDQFCSNVIKEYEKSHFAVLGPKIILKDGLTNPVTKYELSLQNIKKQYRSLLIRNIITKIHILFWIKNILKKLKKRKRDESQIDPEKRHEGIIVHGCFLIFSKEYINIFDGLDSRTFLFREEELLYKRINDNKLLSVYNPSIVIKHNEDSATNALTKNNRKKELFVNKYMIESTKILINDLKGE